MKLFCSMQAKILLILNLFAFHNFAHVCAQNYEKMLFAFLENNKYYYVNIDGERVTEAIYDKPENGGYVWEKGWAKVRRNEKYGIINIQGTESIPCIYEYIDDLVNYKGGNSSFFVARKNGKIGIVDSINHQIVPFELEGLESIIYPENTIWVVKNGKCGALNINSNKITIPLKYKHTDYFGYSTNKGFILLDENNRFGCISTKGQVIIPFDFSDIRWYHDECILFKNYISNKWYLYDKHGKRKEIGLFDEVDAPSGGVARVRKNGLYSYIDLSNRNIIAPFQYTKACAFPFDEDVTTALRQDGRYVLINKEGKEIETIGDFGCIVMEQGVIVTKQGKYGALGLNGETLIPFVYDNLSPISNRNGFMLKFKKNGYWGIVNRHNHILVQPQYGQIFDLIDENLFIVEKEGKWGIINDKNEIVSPFIYDDALRFDGKNYAEIRLGDKRGLIDRQGNQLFLCDEDFFEFRKAQYLYSQIPSDVDSNIPISSIENEQTFAVIIANEQYVEKNVSQVKFAQKDGEVFKEYCEKTLGLPSKNIRFVTNATINQMRSAINWASDMAIAFDGDAKMIVYYSGHGIPDEKTGNSYLLPADGIVGDHRSAYSLDELYHQLGDVPTMQTLVFLDACFSGTSKDGKIMLADSKGVTIKAKQSGTKGNTVVFSACSDDETAFPYKKKKHGMFTYFLLKKLQETKGDISLEELGEYINKNVRQKSMVENGKLQTPTINASTSMSGRLKNMRIK